MIKFDFDPYLISNIQTKKFKFVYLISTASLVFFQVNMLAMVIFIFIHKEFINLYRVNEHLPRSTSIVHDIRNAFINGGQVGRKTIGWTQHTQSATGKLPNQTLFVGLLVLSIIMGQNARNNTKAAGENTIGNLMKKINK